MIFLFNLRLYCIFFLLVSVVALTHCKQAIKNEGAQVIVEEGTEVVEQKEIIAEEKPTAPPVQEGGLLGYWVGYFEKGDEYSDKYIAVDEAFYWNRENKINISLDSIGGGQVIGHSVVAGNDRPFSGSVEALPDNAFRFKVKEPGDDKYDGAFTFTIHDGEMTGQWEAYKAIEIRKRKYTLEKKTFTYDPNIMLEYVSDYVDWNKSVEKKYKMQITADAVDEWVSTQSATSTEKIYEMNASNKLLTVSEVENLKKGDLTIIRNTIYARHGYSFKNRPLRVFFDEQPWYIPVHADIKSDFTDIEKQNITLLLRYEKNAAEYYDSFGRG